MSSNNSKKHPPKMSNTELQTAFNDVYKHLNEIFDSVNSENLDIKSEGSGKPGDMRIVEKKNKQTSKNFKIGDRRPSLPLEAFSTLM